MKKYYYIIALLSFFISSKINAQCIEGNCNNGTGIMVMASGDKYNGEFRDGQRNGKGTYVWKSGAKYQGGWLNDKMHGQGTYIYPDRRYYKGEFSMGNKHGSGTLFKEDGTIIQKGIWKNDVYMENSKTYHNIALGVAVLENLLPVNNYSIDGTGTYINPSILSLEYGINNSFSVGLFGGIANHNFEADMPLNNNQNNRNINIVSQYYLAGASFRINLPLIESGSFLPYFRASAGYAIASEEIRVNNLAPNESLDEPLIRSITGSFDVAESTFIYNATLGIQVYPLKKLGLFVEGGLGFSNLNAGIIYRMQ
jgi:hypothetical protein